MVNRESRSAFWWGQWHQMPARVAGQDGLVLLIGHLVQRVAKSRMSWASSSSRGSCISVLASSSHRLVIENDLRDMRWQAAQNGIDDKDPPSLRNRRVRFGSCGH